MIRALDGSGKLSGWFLAHTRAAMPADVVQRPDAVVSAAHDDEALSKDVGQKILAGSGDLLRASDAQPAPVEDAVLLPMKYLDGRVVLGRKRPALTLKLRSLKDSHGARKFSRAGAESARRMDSRQREAARALR